MVMWPFFVILAFTIVVGIAGLYVAHASQWPEGLDEDPTLDVENHVGDSRPIR